MTSSTRSAYKSPEEARDALVAALGLPEGTLRVDRNGHGFVLIPTDVVSYVVRMLDWANDDDTLSGDED